MNYNQNSEQAELGKEGEFVFDEKVKLYRPDVKNVRIREGFMNLLCLRENDLRLSFLEKITGDRVLIFPDGASYLVEICTTKQFQWMKLGRSKVEKCQADYFAIVRFNPWGKADVQMVERSTVIAYVNHVLDERGWEKNIDESKEDLVKIPVSFKKGISLGSFLGV